MRHRFVLATLGMILLGSFMRLASAEIIVYVGYLDNIHGPRNPADTPTPFDPDAITTSISSGGIEAPHDTGVLLFANFGDALVTINHVRVVTEGGFFGQIWEDVSLPIHLPFTLGPRQNLVLAATVEDPSLPATFNFDTSDFGVALDPVVIVSVDGTQFTCTDIGRVLLGREEGASTGGNETTPYHVLGVISADPRLATTSCIMETPRLSYRQKFLHSYLKAR
jgi:hypothetical protein